MFFIRLIASSFILISLNILATETTYYRSDTYQCEDKNWIMNARVIDEGESFTVNLVYKPLNGDDDGSNTDFIVDKSKIVDDTISLDVTYSGAFRLSQMDTFGQNKAFTLTWLNNKEEPYEGCDKINLKPANLPAYYLQLTIDTLNERPISSGQYVKALLFHRSSPPNNWLPALDQVGAEKARKAAWEAIKVDYPKKMAELYTQVDLTEAKAKQLIRDMKATLVMTNDSSISRKMFFAIDELRTIWTIRNRNNDNKSRVLAINDINESCEYARYSRNYSQSGRWADLLRGFSGIPVELWSRAYANQLLEQMALCDTSSSKSMIDYIKQNWAEIEVLTMAYPEFIADVDKRFSLPKTIKSMRENNWLLFTEQEIEESPLLTSTFKNYQLYLLEPYVKSIQAELEVDINNRLSKLNKLGDYHNYCRDKLLDNRKHKEIFGEVLLDNCIQMQHAAYENLLEKTIKDKVASALEALANNSLSLESTPYYCDQQAENQGLSNWSDRNYFNERCLPILAEKVVEYVNIESKKTIQQLDEIPRTFDDVKQISSILPDMKLYGFYGVSDSFQQAHVKMSKALESIEIKVAEIVKETDLLETEKLSASYRPIIDSIQTLEEVTNTLEDFQVVNTRCGDSIYYNFYSLSNACKSIIRKLTHKKEMLIVEKIEKEKIAACNAIWEATKFPDEYSDKKIMIDHYIDDWKAVPLKEFLCDETEVVGVKDSGFFSSDYLLQRIIKKDGEDVVLTVQLERPNKEGVLTISKFKASTGNIKISHLENPEYELISCLLYKEDECIE